MWQLCRRSGASRKQHRTDRRLRAHPWTRWHLRSLWLRQTGRRLRALLPRICRRIRRIQAIRGGWTGRRVWARTFQRHCTSRHLLILQVQGHRRYHLCKGWHRRYRHLLTLQVQGLRSHHHLHNLRSRTRIWRLLRPIPRRTGLRLRTIHHRCRRITFRGGIGIRGFPTSRCLHYIRRRQAGRCLRTISRHRTDWYLPLSRFQGPVPSHHSISEGFAPSLTPGGTPPLPSSPPTEAPLDNTKFFNENMIKKIGIVAGVVIVGGTIASIVGSRIKHRDSQDS